MRREILGLAMVFALAVTALGQQRNATDEKVAKTKGQHAKGAPANVGPSSGSSIAAGSTLQAELQKSLDVKNARVGDEVVLKTTSSIKQDGTVVVPKGSRLIGRVTEVQQRTKGNAESRLGLIFDRIEGKNLSMPVNASIFAITNTRAAADDVFAADVSGSSATSARTSNSGGLLGGGVLGSATGTVGGVLSGATNTVGSVAGTATQTVGGAANTVVGTFNGIRISQSASGSAGGSTMLSSNSKNVQLEKGVTFNLLVNGSVEKW